MAEGIKKISENVTVANRAFVITSPNVADNDAIAIGTLQTDPTKKGLKMKTSKGTYSYLNAPNVLEQLSVTNALIANQAINKSKIANSAVGTDQLENLAVTEVKLANNSVTRNKIKNGEVIQGKLATNAVINANLVDNCVTNVKILDNTINNSKLLNKTITNTKIANGTINADCLASNCVTNIKITNNTIENSKYKQYSIYGDKIANGAITNVHLSPRCINTVNIMNGAVTGDHLVNNAICERHIADEQITMRCIYPYSITEGKIHDDAVTTSKIRNKNITTAKLADDVLNLIGDPVKYEWDHKVWFRSDIHANGNIAASGIITGTKIYNAVFMDLAEAYTPAPDVTFVPGDIVEVREDGLAYKADGISVNKTIVGVVSNEYAQCFGATDEEIQNNEKIAVGMIGQVHVNVTGPVKIGDYIGACKDGVGVSERVDLGMSKKVIIGKALETNDSNECKKVLCLIYPN